MTDRMTDNTNYKPGPNDVVFAGGEFDKDDISSYPPALLMPAVRRAGYVMVPVGMYEQVVEYLKVGVMDPAFRNVILHMDAETLR